MLSTHIATTGALAETNTATREEIPEALAKAYWMEIETVMSYLANSINPDGVPAQEIIEPLDQDVLEELGHAKQLANRIKEPTVSCARLALHRVSRRELAGKAIVEVSQPDGSA